MESRERERALSLSLSLSRYLSICLSVSVSRSVAEGTTTAVRVIHPPASANAESIAAFIHTRPLVHVRHALHPPKKENARQPIVAKRGPSTNECRGRELPLAAVIACQACQACLNRMRDPGITSSEGDGVSGRFGGGCIVPYAGTPGGWCRFPPSLRTKAPRRNGGMVPIDPPLCTHRGDLQAARAALLLGLLLLHLHLLQPASGEPEER